MRRSEDPERATTRVVQTYDNEKRAEVRALLLMGYSSTRIEKETGLPQRTVRQWRQDSPELAAKEDEAITQAQRRIALMGYDIMETQFGHWQEKAKAEGLTVQETLAVNAGTNTPVDKILKRAELALKGRQGSERIALICEMIELSSRSHVEYIDGEATVVTDPLPALPEPGDYGAPE